MQGRTRNPRLTSTVSSAAPSASFCARARSARDASAGISPHNFVSVGARRARPADRHAARSERCAGAATSSAVRSASATMVSVGIGPAAGREKRRAGDVEVRQSVHARARIGDAACRDLRTSESCPYDDSRRTDGRRSADPSARRGPGRRASRPARPGRGRAVRARSPSVLTSASTLRTSSSAEAPVELHPRHAERIPLFGQQEPAVGIGRLLGPHQQGDLDAAQPCAAATAATDRPCAGPSPASFLVVDPQRAPRIWSAPCRA